jgi:hypothetical protein
MSGFTRSSWNRRRIGANNLRGVSLALVSYILGRCPGCGEKSFAEKAIKRPSGFYYDVKHVATYAPYCDAFIVDQPMAELLARPTVGLSERYGVKIFSLNNWNEMLTWLDQLEHGMSDAHKQALVQAYPSLMEGPKS